MSAHIRELQVRCLVHGCTRLATVEVYSTYNAYQGRFCRCHGQQRLRELLGAEAARVKRP